MMHSPIAAALGLDAEVPDYDMDSEDEQWLNRQVKSLKMEITALKFENMIDRLEKGSGQTVSFYWPAPTEYGRISVESANMPTTLTRFLRLYGLRIDALDEYFMWTIKGFYAC